MAKHEVVNEILEYLDTRKDELDRELHDLDYDTHEYDVLSSMREVYEHLIAKLEDDYR